MHDHCNPAPCAHMRFHSLRQYCVPYLLLLCNRYSVPLLTACCGPGQRGSRQHRFCSIAAPKHLLAPKASPAAWAPPTIPSLAHLCTVKPAPLDHCKFQRLRGWSQSGLILWTEHLIPGRQGPAGPFLPPPGTCTLWHASCGAMGPSAAERYCGACSW